MASVDGGTGGFLLPTSPETLPVVAYGQGLYLIDTDGNRYLDGCSGALAANLGHGNRAIVDAMSAQAARVAFVHRSQFRNVAADEFAAEIAEIAPAGLSASLYAGSGSEAIELAVRAAAIYDRVRGRGDRWRLVSRDASYHGSTIGSISLSGHAGRRIHAAGLLHDFAVLSAPDIYHYGQTHAATASTVDLIDRLRAEITQAEPETVLAVVTETIGGAAAGALVPPVGYYEELRALCDEFGILWIADEVMCGFGRTGRWFAVEHWAAAPDIIAFGKGAGGGYLPLSGIIVADQVAKALVAERGYAPLGHTFTNSPVQTAVGLATIREMRRLDAVGHAARMGVLLGGRLAALREECELVGDVRGIGLMWAIELVADRDNRRPYAAEESVTRRLVESCRRAGLLVYPAAGWLPGGVGDAVMIAPPLLIDEEEIADLLDRLRHGLGALEPALRGAAQAPGWSTDRAW